MYVCAGGGGTHPRQSALAMANKAENFTAQIPACPSERWITVSHLKRVKGRLLGGVGGCSREASGLGHTMPNRPPSNSLSENTGQTLRERKREHYAPPSPCLQDRKHPSLFTWHEEDSCHCPPAKTQGGKQEP